MSKLQINEKFEGLTSEQVFEASKAAFNELGMVVFKVRSFAFLLQARTASEEDLVNANLIVSAFENEFNLTLSSETVDQESLIDLADKFIEKIKNILR